MTTALPIPSPASYRALDGCYDEMVDSAGAARAHWAHLAGVFSELGVEELLRRQEEASRLIDQDGVVYNTYDDEARPGGRWLLDAVPIVLSSREWEAIERGLIERAELLDLVLADLYGKRELLRRRVLAPEVVFGHAGFLRPWDQIRLPGGHQLVTYAADIGRDAGGRPLVLSDRAQAPSGFGYALEARSVISRVFPTLYRDSQVHRLAPFFRSLRVALQNVAPENVEDPRIVVLTPGPWNETAFEHAFLASQLGYPLVEGADLVTRGGRVWMRSLGQLEPVHVILRRVDAWFCDPLELKPDSQLGVPGLVEAARSGTVSIVNPLGSSVLENAALTAFLPRLAQRLLGGPLVLDSVPTWWCGEDAGTPLCAGQYRAAGVAPDLASSRSSGGVRLGAERRRARRAQAADRGPAAWLGGTGAAGDGERSDAHRRRAGPAPRRAARIRDRS